MHIHLFGLYSCFLLCLIVYFKYGECATSCFREQPTTATSVARVIQKFDSYYISKVFNHQKRVKRDVAYTIVQNTSNFTSEMANFSYSIYNMTNGGDTNQLTETIANVRLTISNVHHALNLTSTEITNVTGVIESSDFKNNFEDYYIEVENCKVRMEAYLSNPDDVGLIDRMKNCYTIMNAIRGISDIVTGVTLSGTGISLIQVLIDTRQYCNGTEINQMFKYLYGIFVEGCTYLILAEQLKDQATSHVTECDTMIGQIATSMESVYDTCTRDGCSDISANIEDLVTSNRNEGTQTLTQKLSDILPWFKFILLKTEATDFIPTSDIYNKQLLNSVEIAYYSATSHLYIYWSAEVIERCVQDTSTLSTTEYETFRLEIKQANVREITNELNLEVLYLPGQNLEYAIVIGHFPTANLSNTATCVHSVTFPTTLSPSKAALLNLLDILVTLVIVIPLSIVIP